MKAFPIQYLHKNLWKSATCSECLHQYLSDRIDIEWDIDQGTMRLSNSKNNDAAVVYTKDPVTRM